ncbi:MAG: twin-arginine translocation signal domain-containing protein [Candidatus Contendobacter sp.]|nr:twin-arginine translocation signal domain-containing protein [Candidatus Contendobacter sp.]
MPELDLSRRTFLRRSSVAALGATVAAYAGHPAWAEQDSMPPPIPKTPGRMDVVDTASAAPGFKAAETVPASPQDALQRLLNGNQRFVANRLLEPNHSPERRAEISKSQQPFATIFGCVDSRVPPEIIFDQGLGDLFVIRTAGQVIDEAVLGSIEFGSLELKIPLILVLGHERCGAVKASIEALEHGGEAHGKGKSRGKAKPSAEPGEIGYLVKGIKPAIDKARAWGMGDLAENAMRANVLLTMSQLKKSPVLAAALESGQLKIVGGRYDLDSGLVEVLFS